MDKVRAALVADPTSGTTTISTCLPMTELSAIFFNAPLRADARGCDGGVRQMSLAKRQKKAPSVP
jgi:hypothetical protein